MALETLKQSEPTETPADTSGTINAGQTLNIAGQKLNVKGPMQSEALLKAMQDEYDRRTPNSGLGRFNTFLESMKDAVAITSRDPGSAMAARDAEKRAREESLFNMRANIASLQGQQKQQAQTNAFMAGQGQPAQAGQGQPAQAGQGQPAQAASMSPAMQMIQSLPAALQGRGMQLARDGDWDKLAKLAQDTSIHRSDLEKNMSYINSLPEGDDKERLKRNTLEKTYGTYTYIDENGYEHKYTLGGPTDPAFNNPPNTATTPTTTATTPTGAFDPKKSYGTPAKLLDNLGMAESSNDPYAVNPSTKTMGKYQFDPHTVAMLHKQGVKFNPFDPDESRAAADYYIQQLVKKNGGDYNKAMAQYGGFVKSDPMAYVSKVMSGVAPSTPNTTPLPNPFPRRSEEYKTQEAKNAQTQAEIIKKQAETNIETTAKQEQAAAELYGKDYGAGPQHKQQAIDTIGAADRVITLANDPTYKKLMGYYEGGNKAATALVKALNFGTAKLFGQEEFEKAMSALNFNEKERTALQRLQTDSKKLGIEYTAQMFKGARLGIGLEKLGSEGKGISPSFTPETNKLYASITKRNAEFVLDAHKTFRDDWLTKNPGKQWGDFIQSKEYDTMLDKHLENEQKLTAGTGVEFKKLSPDAAIDANKGSKFDKYRK